MDHDSGGHRAAVIYTLIETALCRTRHKAVYAARIDDLMPWTYAKATAV